MDIQFEKAKWIEESDGTWFCFLIRDYKDIKKVKEFIQTMKSIMYVLTIKVFRKKRSINANNYAWELMGELADRIPKEPEELVKEAMATIKEFCEEKPNCEGCTLHDEVVNGCKLDDVPANWKLD